MRSSWFRDPSGGLSPSVGVEHSCSRWVVPARWGAAPPVWRGSGRRWRWSRSVATSMETHAPAMRRSGVIHEAFLYAGVDEFVSGMVPFVEAGRRAGGRVLVAVTGANVDALRSALPRPQDSVQFVEMESAGRNPGRIISMWRDFLSAADGGSGGVRGSGEPIWSGRSGSDRAECHQHELLMNLAFGAGRSWRLACPYDLATLPDQALEAARRNHPAVFGAGGRLASPSYVPDYEQVLREPLPPRPAD